MPSNTRGELERLLHERNEHPERLAELDREILERFRETHAVFVLDMSGFSRLTMRYGITHFLAMIQRLHELALPILPRHHGKLVKTEADNVFAVFPDVADALAAARDLRARLDAANLVLPADWDLHASVGIGHGEILMVEGEDFYGNEVNLASKLGEDIGEGGDILLTEAAYRRIAAAGLPFDARSVTISGMEFAYYRFRGESRPAGEPG